MFFLKTIFGAPLMAIACLAYAAPWFGVVGFGLWAALSIDLSAFDETVHGVMEALPRRRGRHFDGGSNPEGATRFVLLYLCAGPLFVLGAYRLQRAALWIAAVPRRSGARDLFSARSGWVRVFLPPAIVLLGFIALLFFFFDPFRERLTTPTTGFSPLDVFALAWNQTRWIYVGLVAIFIPFGVKLIARAAGYDALKGLFGLAGSRLGLLAVFYVILSIPLVGYPLEGLAALLVAGGGAEPAFPLWAHLAGQTLFGFTSLSVAAALFFRRRVLDPLGPGAETAARRSERRR